MKWFISTISDFSDILGVYREICKNPSPWSHSVVLLLLQVFEGLDILEFLKLTSSFHPFSFVENVFLVKHSIKT